MPGPGWEIAGLTPSDVAVVLLMLAVFVLAVVLPYPGGRK